MSPKDERLAADLDEATSRLRASLKACRKILDTYRPRIASDAQDLAEDPPLFDWPEDDGKAPPCTDGD